VNDSAISFCRTSIHTRIVNVVLAPQGDLNMKMRFSSLLMLLGVEEKSVTIRSRHFLITTARHTCLAAILFSLLSSIAWGQDGANQKISTLTRELKQGDSFVRWRAAKALLRIGSYSKAEVPALIEALKIEEGDISERAHEALVKIGADALPALIEALKYRGYSKASEALVAIGATAVPLLIEALKGSDGDLRLGALEALREINLRGLNPNPTTLLPFLIEALKDPNPAIRSAAALALSGVTGLPGEGPGYSRKEGEFVWPFFLPKPVIPTLPKSVILILIEALKDQDRAVRSQAAYALAGIGPAAKAAAPALIESLEDRNLDVCGYATLALKNVGGKSPTSIPALIKLLRHPDSGIREVATEALANIGAPAVPSLVRVLIGQDSALRVKSYYALLSIGDVFALVATLKSRDKDLRSLVLEAIEDIRVDPTRSLHAPDLLFDPSRKYLIQTERTPCTYEGDGRTIFVSELDTGKSFPILASAGG
jgi:HEAT repeat protein